MPSKVLRSKSVLSDDPRVMLVMLLRITRIVLSEAKTAK